MSTRSAACPTAADLAGYAAGALSADARAAVARHLEGCTACRRAVPRASETAVGPDESLPDLSRPGGGPAADVPPELLAAGTWADVRELGRGGMGVVYLAKNTLMDRPEVLKVVGRGMTGRPGAGDRFLQEIRSAARLQHPNVVAAYSAQQLGGLLVLAMEYVPGVDLRRLVDKKGPLPVRNACFFAHQVAQGLQHAHERGMVHRDVKPQNLMLARDGPRQVVKILDFGLAKARSEKAEDSGLTRSGQVLGTPDYIAPEQSLDASTADIRADIYSLGCTLYCLLTGHPPFSGPSVTAVLLAHQAAEPKLLAAVRPDVPAELAAVLAKMMAKRPADRYQTPAEVAKALWPFVQKADGSASVAMADPVPAAATDTTATFPPPLPAPRRTTTAIPVARPRRPWRRPAAAGGGVLLGLAAVWAAGLLTPRPADPSPVADRQPVADEPPAAPPTGVELLRNPGCEERPVAGKIPGWEVIRGDWRPRGQDPAPFEGKAYFFAGVSKTAELRQDVDVSAHAAAIDAGRLRLAFAGHLQSYRVKNKEKPDTAQVLVEYLPADKARAIAAYVSPLVRASNGWREVRDTRIAPVGTRWVRVRLLSTRETGHDNDGYFDGLSLKAEPADPPAEPVTRTAEPAPAPIPPEPPPVDRRPVAVRGTWGRDGDEVVLVKHDNTFAPAFLAFGSPDWADLTVECRAKKLTPRVYDNFGLAVGFAGERSRIHFMAGGGWADNVTTHTVSVDGQGRRVSGGPRCSIGPNTWYRLKVTVRGETVSCFVDDRPVFTYKHPRPVTGRVALATTEDMNCELRFRDIRVTAGDGKVLWDGLPDLPAVEPPKPAAPAPVVTPAPPKPVPPQKPAPAPTPTPGLVVSRFAAGDADGWTARTLDGDGPARPFEARGTGADGHLFAAAADRAEWGWQAPAKFHGDHAAAVGKFLRYRVAAGKLEPRPNRLNPEWAVRLRGGGHTLFVPLTARTEPAADGSLTTVMLKLDAYDGWRRNVGGGTGGSPATDAHIREALANVTDLWIRGGYSPGPDWGRLGGVELGADPGGGK